MTQMKYRLAEHVTLTEVDNEVVLLDLNAGQYFGLNHVGARFLKQLGNDKQEVIANLAKYYQTDQTQVESDINELMDSLIEQKLVALIK